MGQYIIKGGNKLNGEVFINGSKNAVLPILSSTILNSGISILKNVPIILDTLVAIDILKDLGCDVTYNKNTLIINSKNINKTNVKEDLVKKMRSSIIFLGALISRFKEASISYPGGCNLGKRPIDFHLLAFKNMGINIEDDNKNIKASVDNIKPTIIELPFASVGATQNIILASIFVNGKITIKNCAKEPEIIDMVNFLIKMGANIYGAGTDVITIEGVEKLNETVEYTIMSDRIEAGTFLCMTAIAGGDVNIKGINPKYLTSLTDILQKIGCQINIDKDNINIKSNSIIKPIEFLETNPYPYFPTDLQPQIMSVLAIANGKSIIKENIFEARNKHIKEFNKLGCNILENENTFIIKGTKNLKTDTVFAKDLRGGAGLISLSLFINGEITVKGACYIKRGYENIEKKLGSLGADIKYIKD